MAETEWTFLPPQKCKAFVIRRIFPGGFKPPSGGEKMRREKVLATMLFWRSGRCFSVRADFDL